jgi:3-phenylpropionate/cinnamic acid dioxygenase small subunit
MTTPAAAQGLPAPNEYAQSMNDRLQIIDVISSVGFHADQRRWDLVEAAFAEEAVIDYRSHETAAAGQSEPQALTPREIVTAWQTQLPGYLHTQHLVTNPIIRIDGDWASATSQVYATHYLPNAEGEDYWTFIGFYEHELQRTSEGWKITLMRANKQFELGNAKLPQLAAARVESGEIATAP